MKTKKIDYKYEECGLDNVIIKGLEVRYDDDGEEMYCIPRVNGLHKAIAASILLKSSGVSPKELRFLRTEMGLSQEELAAILKVTRATINRWENGQTRIEPNAEFVFRMIAAENLGVDITNKSAAELSESCVPKTGSTPILIDGSDPKNYRSKAA